MLKLFKNVEAGYNEMHFLVVNQVKYREYCVVIFLKYSKLLYCCRVNISNVYIENIEQICYYTSMEEG